MTLFRVIALAAFAALVIAGVTGPAGSSATASCGAITQIRPRPARELRQVRGAAVRNGLQGLRFLPQRRRLSSLAPVWFVL